MGVSDANCETVSLWHCVHVTDGDDETGTLLLQLACILHMVHEWKGTTVLRIMIIGEGMFSYLETGPVSEKDCSCVRSSEQR